MTQSKEQIELCLSHYFNDNADPASKEASYALRQQLSSSIKGVCWFIENSPFAQPTTYRSAFECFKFRLFYFPSEFDQNILGRLFTFLFQQALQLVPNLPPEIISELCNAQALLTFLVFPELCNNLFDIIFQFPVTVKFRYLKFFCEYLILPTPQNVNRFNLVKQSFEQRNLSGKIFQQILNGIQTKNPDVVSTLASFTRWSKNIDYLNNNELMNFIFSDPSAELAPSVLKFIGSIAQRSMPNDFKYQLIVNLQVPARIQTYFQHYNNNIEILKSCAEVISILGYSLTPPLPEMYQLLIAFFNMGDEISEKVTVYFRSFTRSNPNLCKDIALIVIKRLIIYFKTTPLNSSFNYLSQLHLILRDCLEVNSNMFYTSYQALIMDIKAAQLNQKLAELSALISITNYMFRNSVPIFDDLMNEYFLLAKQLFQWKPPINEQLLFAIYSFLRSFLYRNDLISKDYNQDVLNQLTLFSLEPSLTNEARKHFQALFYLYVKSKYKYCPSVTNNLQPLMVSCSKDLIKVSALSLKSITGKQKAEKTMFCFGVINNILTQNPNNEGVGLTLAFLSSYSSESNDQMMANEIALLQRIAPLCLQNDDLLANLIQSTVGLYDQGFQFFNALLPNVKQVCSLSAAADATISFLDFYQRANSPAGVQNVMKISIALVNVFIELAKQTLSMPLNINNVSKVMAMIRSCYNLFTACYSVIVTVPEVANKLLLFTKDLAISKYEVPSILLVLYKFLTRASEGNAQFIATNFTGASLFFVIAPRFDPNKREWDHALNGLIELHSKLQKEAYQPFCQNLSATFSSFSLSSDFVQNYILALESDQRAKPTLIKKFFTDALAARNSMTW